MNEKIMRAVSGSVIGLVMMLLPLAAHAQTVTSTSTIQANLDLIASLQAQIQDLQAKAKALVQQEHAAIAQLVTTLRQGTAGDNVKILQALLAADPSIYPEGVISGFYGRMTAQAVKRFQHKHGLEQVGDVGPKTLKKLNEFLREHPMAFATSTDDGDDDHDNDHGKKGEHGKSGEDHGKGDDHKPCAIVPPGHLIAPGWLKKHDGERPVVPPCQHLPEGIMDKLEGFFHPGTTTPPATTTPPVADTVAPVISALVSSGIATTSASVNWTTNENATGKVYYTTTAPVNTATALMMSNVSLSMSHSFLLTSLMASTTYYYIVESKDGANNAATSSQQMFTTTN